MGFEIVIVLVLIVFNGVLAMSELAVVSARRARMQQRAAEGDVGAKVAIELAEEPTRFLSTVQIGITLVGILAGAFGGATLAGKVSDLLADMPVIGRYSGVIGIALVVMTITYLSLVVGELVPKRLALHSPEAIASRVARPMRVLSVVATPVVALLTISTEAAFRILRIKPSTDPPVTDEEIASLLEQGAQAGVFEVSEHGLVTNILELADRHVAEIIVPRHEVVYLNVEASQAELRDTISTSPQEVYPVCRGGLDDVLGFASMRTLWAQLDRRGEIDLVDALEPATYVPENISILRLMEDLRASGRERALVIDEYGTIQGLVTLQDIFDAIVGELENVNGDEEEIVQRDAHSWYVDGATSVDELKELIEVATLPHEDSGYFHTAGGFVMDQLGRVPHTGDAFEWNGYRFEIADMDGRRVDKLIVTRLEPAEAGAVTI